MRPASDWQELIRRADSPKIVAAVLRGYALELVNERPDDYELLAAHCRPFGMDDATAIATFATHVTKCERVFIGDALTAELLREIAAMFQLASSRIAVLQSFGSAPG